MTKYEYDLSTTKIFILILYVLTLIGYFSIQKTDLNILTPEKIFIYLFSLMIFPGILLLSTGKNADFIVTITYFSFLAFLAGFGFTRGLFIKSNTSNRFMIENRVKTATVEPKKLINVILILSIISIIVFVATGNFNRSSALVFFYDLFSDRDFSDQLSVAEYRSSVYETGTIGSRTNIIGNYIATLILPLSSAFLFIEGKKRKKKKLIRLGVIFLFITLLFSIGTGSRLMTMRTLLYFFVIITFIYKVNMKSIAQFGFLAFLLLILVTSILGRGEQHQTFGGKISENAVKSFERVSLAKGNSSLLVYQYYPLVEDFEKGKTFMADVLGTFSKEESLARKMFYFATGRSGTAGPQTFGEFYANFGFFGQIIFSFFTGVVLGLVLTMTLRKKSWKTLDICAFAYIYLGFGYMGYSSAFSFKSMGVHGMFVLYLFLRFISIEGTRRYLT